MQIDTSSIADRVNQLRPNITTRSQMFTQAAINNPNKSQTDALEDSAAKRRAHFAAHANKSTVAFEQQSGVGPFESEPGNPINSLFADWGKSDSNYDLNSDGTVNTQDLLLLLEKLATPENHGDRSIDPEPPNITPVNSDISDSQTDKPNNRIDALLADWGKADSNYDFNADGTVNTKDLLMLLEMLAANEGPVDPTVITNPDTSVSQSDKPDNRIDALMADWGKADSKYDFNADGTVNTKDLLMLLEKLAAKENAADPTVVTNPDTTVSQTDKPENRIDALLADWGKADSNYDFNADGTVNTQDLLMLLEMLAANEGPVDPTVVTLDTSDSQTDKPDNRIDALMADWGKADSNYDFNNDGTVNTQDLLLLLEKLAAKENAADPTIITNPDTTVSQTDKPDNRIDALMADWGKADSFYDFNNDGTVSTEDLLMLFEKLSQSNGMPGDVTPIADQLFSAPADTFLKPVNSADEDANSKIQRIARGLTEKLFRLTDQDQDGKIGAKEAGHARTIFDKLDLNGDSQIDKLELANMIQDMLMGKLDFADSANLNKFIHESMRPLADQGNQFTSQPAHRDSHTSVSAYQRVSTDQAANQLSQRMANNGEAELRKFLATSDFTNVQKRSILSELHNLNMGNLGVNVVG
ncbi:MAG: hypothetical protein IH984_09120 [Planctomycetes bacterium]|nr:hypothetical protein [Planctomycetota bacterium]